MTAQTFAVLAARLRTLDPFFDEPMAENYYESLHDIPEQVAQAMCRGVLRRFDKRPAPKTLREWAHALAPAKTFDIAQVAGPAPKRLAAPGADPSFRGVPEGAKAVIERLKQRARLDAIPSGAPPPDPAHAGDWGIEWDDGKGVAQRMPARWSEANARALAREKAGRYPHLTCRPYRKAPAGNIGKALRAGRELPNAFEVPWTVALGAGCGLDEAVIEAGATQNDAEYRR